MVDVRAEARTLQAEARTLQAEARTLQAGDPVALFAETPQVTANSFRAFLSQVSQAKNEKRTMYVYEA